MADTVSRLRELAQTSPKVREALVGVAMLARECFRKHAMGRRLSVTDMNELGDALRTLDDAGKEKG